VQHLIPRIYDCAVQPSLWPDVLQDIARAAGAFGAMVFDCETLAGHDWVRLRQASSVYDPDVVTQYVAAQNVWEVRDQARFATLSSRGDEVNLIRCDDLFSGRAELENQPNVQAMMQMGVHYRAGALLCKDTMSLDRFALQFRRAQGAIVEDKRLQVQGILQHVAKSLSIGRAFGAAQGQNIALVAALNSLPFGVAIMRQNGDLIFHNTSFLSLSDAYGLRGAGSQKMAIAQLPDAMRRLLHGVQEHGKFGARPLREAAFLHSARADMGLFIEISPIAAHPELESFGAGAYLVSLLDSQNAHLIDASVLQRFFPITEAETLVLDLVLKGHTNAEIADMRGRSLETVNSQVKALIQKSGTRNRTELVRVAVSLSVATLGHKTARPKHESPSR
jgi:DNA-binding CsgD family transcriptional regulator